MSSGGEGGKQAQMTRHSARMGACVRWGEGAAQSKEQGQSRRRERQPRAASCCGARECGRAQGGGEAGEGAPGNRLEPIDAWRVGFLAIGEFAPLEMLGYLGIWLEMVGDERISMDIFKESGVWGHL